MIKMKIPKNYRIKEIVKLLSRGYKVKEIAKVLSVSVSTIYRDYQNFRLNANFVISDILYKIDKINIEKSLQKLSYSDICLLAKRFNCCYWIRSKLGKISKLVPFLSVFFYFDLNPVSFTKESIKRAYFKKAKQLHPDMTKKDTNKEFCNMKIYYNVLLKTVELI